MADVDKKELQDTLDGLSRYLANRRNFLAQDLYRQMHRDDCIGESGHIYCHNDDFEIDVRVAKRRKVL